MALILQHQVFDPDSYFAPVVGISAELAEHDSGVHQHQGPRSSMLHVVV